MIPSASIGPVVVVVVARRSRRGHRVAATASRTSSSSPSGFVVVVVVVVAVVRERDALSGAAVVTDDVADDQTRRTRSRRSSRRDRRGPSPRRRTFRLHLRRGERAAESVNSTMMKRMSVSDARPVRRGLQQRLPHRRHVLSRARTAVNRPRRRPEVLQDEGAIRVTTASGGLQVPTRPHARA